MKIFIILIFQIWIISVYSSDLSYFDFLLNENKTNNPNKDIITEDKPENIPNEDIITKDNPENIPNDGITNDKIFPNKDKTKHDDEKLNDKIHTEIDIFMQTKLSGIFNHAFNLMFKQIEHNFDNISAEIEFFLSKSKNYTAELKELQTNMNNINILVDKLSLNNKNLTKEIHLISNVSKLHSKFQAEIYTIMANNKINFKNFVEDSNSNFVKLTNKVDQLLLKLSKIEDFKKNVATTTEQVYAWRPVTTKKEEILWRRPPL